MNTRPAKIFLLGLTLAVGAVVGLAPAGEARPIVEIDPSGPVVELPPTTVKPPKGIDPCDVRNCDDLPVLKDPCINIRGCPSTTTTSTTTPPDTKPKPPRIPPKKSDNPDVVVQTPRFTG